MNYFFSLLLLCALSFKATAAEKSIEEKLMGLMVSDGNTSVLEEFFFKKDHTLLIFNFRDPLISQDKNLPKDIREQPSFEVRFATWKVDGNKLIVVSADSKSTYKLDVKPDYILLNENSMKIVDRLKFFEEFQKRVGTPPKQ